MNKKGFTLAELLGVLVVLALISMIAIPAVANIIKDYKNQACEIQLKYVIEAGKSWAAENLNKLPSESGKYTDVTIADLIKYGYLDEDLVNPKTKHTFDSSFVVRISKNGKVFDYTIYDDGEKLTININNYCKN